MNLNISIDLDLFLDLTFLLLSRALDYLGSFHSSVTKRLRRRCYRSAQTVQVPNEALDFAATPTHRMNLLSLSEKIPKEAKDPLSAQRELG